MNYYIIELQRRPDGTTNASIVAKGGFASAYSYYHDRLSKGYASTAFTKVLVTLLDEDNTVVEQADVVTAYEPET